MGGRQNSMVLSAPTILWPWVRIPSTPSTFYSISIVIGVRKGRNKRRKGRDWSIFLKIVVQYGYPSTSDSSIPKGYYPDSKPHLTKKPAAICQIPATRQSGERVMQHQIPKKMAPENFNQVNTFLTFCWTTTVRPEKNR